ncbi:hypothetical protein CROQUDRAFT_661785 [Cronartium quercuum f. sp. fusiforme G11]|uniref:Rho-GAP domain-containing protein n=1 Tax=Cronartium quercuum f. sp. fusiforme G11 TaxID=708437 RepID=A0A9P6NBU0_9BASI|nr:hypothetical protein CROQUDRAFT_661785 [Cronartium quercuum f. sp. fusiforme G11]
MLKFRFPSARRVPNSNLSNESEPNSQIGIESNEIPTSSSSSSSSFGTNTITNTSNNTIIPNLIGSPSTSSSEPNLSSIHPIPLTKSNLPSPSNSSNQSPVHSNLNNSHSSNSSHMAPKKTRRKSYGGLRAMLGINQKPEDAPPLPVPIPPSDPSPSNHISNSSIDASTSPSNSLISIPPSPIIAESRPSTSSLRPFPFLGGIRRKSANSNAPKPNPSNLPSSINSTSNPNHQVPSLPTSGRSASPTTSIAQPQKVNQLSLGHRIYSHGSSKKAQSVDDLSQFGILPKPRIKSRRSVEELFDLSTSRINKICHNNKKSNLIDDDLHKGLDQIGELAGSLATIKTGKNQAEDNRHPRLSNPKTMRTVYGVPIEDLFWRDGDGFPLLVNVLVELIEEKGLDQQGIYRVPGEKRVIENLQASIDERGVNGLDIWEDSFKDVHNLSGLLKLFLREIPGGVIPFDRYDSFLAVSGLDESLRTSQLQSHIKELPKPNRILLLRLVRHFQRVVAHAEANSMLAHNVAIVFAPSLFRSGSEASNPLLSMQNIGKASAIVRHLVLNANDVFESEETDEVIKSITTTATSKRKSILLEKGKSLDKKDKEKTSKQNKSNGQSNRRHSKHGTVGSSNNSTTRQSYQAKKKS